MSGSVDGFQWKNKRYPFATGTLDVKCIGFIKRFTITDFDRHLPTATTVITTDTWDCFHLAQKQFEYFLEKQKQTDIHDDVVPGKTG